MTTDTEMDQTNQEQNSAPINLVNIYDGPFIEEFEINSIKIEEMVYLKIVYVLFMN